MYRPFEGNHLHWALHLEMDQNVASMKPSANILTSKPTPSLVKRLITPFAVRGLPVCEVNSADLPEFEKASSSVKPQNDVALWKCQDYSSEILERVEEECIVDGKDKPYIKGKREKEVLRTSLKIRALHECMRTNLTLVLSSKNNLSSVRARLLKIDLVVVLIERFIAMGSVSSTAIIECNTEYTELERRRNSITKECALHTVIPSLFTCSML